MNARNQREGRHYLNERQQRFVDFYLASLNATQSYIQAGYKASTDEVARVEGSKLLAKPNVQIAVIKASQKLAERTGVKQEDVIRENQRLAFTDIRDFLEVSETGVKVKPSSGWTEDQARAVASVREHVTAQGVSTIDLRLHDKQKALAEIAARLWPVPKGEPEKPAGPVTNIQYNVTFVTRSRNGDDAQG